VCFDLGSGFSAGAKCIGRFVGQLQPYVVYVPKKAQPKDGWGMTLLLHSLSANYNQYTNSHNQSELGDRGPGSLVLTPAGRGPDGFYAGIAEADTFEAWADVARHYRLDPDWTTVSGYSMGGFGTYRLLARWPDLFARGFSTVGIPGTVNDQIASLRNTPIMAWNADADELVQLNESEQAVKDLTAAGLRFDERLFTSSDHLTLATNDEYSPAAEFLGTHRVDRNPAHVTYVVDPTEDSSAAQTIGDHAYWVSGLAVRDPKKAQDGTFDARSEAFGTGDGKPTGLKQGGGTLNGGTHGPMPYVERSQDWTAAPRTKEADRLDVRATNIASATVDTKRALLSCAPQVDMQSDGPLDLRLACPPTPRAKRCAKTVRVTLPRVRGRRVVLVTVTRRNNRVKRVKARNIRHVSVRRVSKRAFSLKIYLHTSAKRGQKPRRVVVQRRIGACGR
jgi:pimeloyl-ACP methyl ester carboxylesterase